MSVERVAVLTAVISAAVGAGGLLLTWHRGSTVQRPRVARALAGLTIGFALVLIVVLAFAGGGSEAPAPGGPRPLSAGEYRERLIGICVDHGHEARRIEDAEGERPVFGSTVQFESRTVDRLRGLRPPAGLAEDHRRAVQLWGRRVTILGAYYDRYREEWGEPGFRREFAAAVKDVNALSASLQRRFAALGVTPECDLFV